MNDKTFDNALSSYFKLKICSNQTNFDVRLKILKDIADYINLNISSVKFTNASFIHPDHMQIIDDQWKQILQNDFQISQEDLNIYYQLKYNRLITNHILHKILEFLSNHNYTIRFGKEKILKSSVLNSLLAVDGFMGYSFCDLTHYIENLKTEKILNDNILCSHVQTVRKMYDIPYLKLLSGNDAAAIVFLSLLQLYEKYVKSWECIRFYRNDVDNYLLKNSKTYSDIRIAKEKLDEIIYFYKINVINISKIAYIKVKQLHLRFLKK